MADSPGPPSPSREVSCLPVRGGVESLAVGRRWENALPVRTWLASLYTADNADTA